MTAPPSLDDKRVAIEHMRLENAYDFPACVGTPASRGLRLQGSLALIAPTLPE